MEGEGAKFDATMTLIFPRIVLEVLPKIHSATPTPVYCYSSHRSSHAHTIILSKFLGS